MRASRALALALAALLLSGCAGDTAGTGSGATTVKPGAAATSAPAGPAARPATGTAGTATGPSAGPSSSAPASAAGAASPATTALAPALAGARPAGPVLPASAGALVDADVPGAQQAVNIDVAFGGVLLGTAANGERIVGYPSLAVQAAFDGTLVAHVKLARFRCRADGSLDRSDCRGRTVDYGDADARSTTVDVADDGQVTVEVTAAAYRYGTGVDRATGLRPRPTGERLHLRAVVTPGVVLSRRGRKVMWRPLAEVSGVTVGRPGSAGLPSGSAQQDDGYPNTYRAVLRER